MESDLESSLQPYNTDHWRKIYSFYLVLIRFVWNGPSRIERGSSVPIFIGMTCYDQNTLTLTKIQTHRVSKETVERGRKSESEREMSSKNKRIIQKNRKLKLDPLSIFLSLVSFCISLWLNLSWDICVTFSLFRFVSLDSEIKFFSSFHNQNLVWEINVQIQIFLFQSIRFYGTTIRGLCHNASFWR